MPGSPHWKVYSDTGQYMAACRYVEDAARLLAPGWTIRAGHRHIVWTEGKEHFLGVDAFDECARVVLERMAVRGK